MSTRQFRKPLRGQAPVLRILFSERKASARGPAIFVDRDGVINCRRPGDYVLEPTQFVFVPGIRAALRQLSDLGFPIIVISNQAAVGKRLLTVDGLREITARMQLALLEDGTTLTAAYYCPHRSEDNCVCRKPQPGLLYAAAHDFNIDLSRSVFIGDSGVDAEAARAAGCRPVLFWADVVAVSPNPSLESLEMTKIEVALKAADLLDRVQKWLATPVVNERF